jgi:alkanesulfonate monooxygenase SsuD/methylene tetrahydromethanopterin reductase-like flavin-dependent oxidoreductase (luciferase family)
MGIHSRASKSKFADVKERARKLGREDEIRFAVNGFCIVKETEEEAIELLAEIQGKADKEAVAAFGDAVKQAGSSTRGKKGMWADSKFEDLVQYNDGFKTKLIGTKEQVADRILLLKSLGIDIVLLAFLHYEDDIEHYGREVLPLIRKLEKEGRGRDAEEEIERTGEVYRAKKNVEA